MFKRPIYLAAFLSLGVALPATIAAQDIRTTDPRLYPFLGCWKSDTTAGRSAQGGALTCVIPVAGTPDVDVMNVVDGRVASRHRIEANGRKHDISGQGCRGQEQTRWSPLVRRIYLRAEYVCNTGIAGGSLTLYSFLPTGEWLEVTAVRSGGGYLVRSERRVDAGVPNNLPREIAGQVGAQRLAVVTARAEAATSLQPEDVIETLRSTDSTITRVWLLETRQHFQLRGDQFAVLTRAEVPSGVLQAMMAAPPRYQLGSQSADEYLSSPGWRSETYYAPYSSYAPTVYYNGYPYPGAYPYPCCYPYYQSYSYSSYNNTSYSSYNNTNNVYTSYPMNGYGYGGYGGYYGGYYPPEYYGGPVYTNARAFPYSTYSTYRPSAYNAQPVGVRPQGQVRVIPASPGPVGRRR